MACTGPVLNQFIVQCRQCSRYSQIKVHQGSGGPLQIKCPFCGNILIDATVTPPEVQQEILNTRCYEVIPLESPTLPQAVNMTFVIKATDAQGNPVEGARVYYRELQWYGFPTGFPSSNWSYLGTTNSAGQFSFGLYSYPGQYEFKAEKDSFTASKTVSASSGVNQVQLVFTGMQPPSPPAPGPTPGPTPSPTPGPTPSPTPTPGPSPTFWLLVGGGALLGIGLLVWLLRRRD